MYFIFMTDRVFSDFPGGDRRPVRRRRDHRVSDQRSDLQTGEIAIRQSHVFGARDRTVRHMFQ